MRETKHTQRERHTPGPWHCDEEAIAVTNEEGFVIRYENGYRIAETYGARDSFFRGSALANARLIALAPEMFELARAVAGLYGSDVTGPNDPSRGLAKQARALIAQVYGGLI